MTTPDLMQRLSRHLPILIGGAAAWLALTAGDPASWLIGAPVIVLAAWLAPPRAAPSAGLRLWPAIRFAGVLLAEIFTSAVAVARVVLRPRLDVAPGVVTYDLSLRDPAAQAVFMNAVTLTPGTLSAALGPDRRLLVHALDTREDCAGALRTLEGRVAALFGTGP